MKKLLMVSMLAAVLAAGTAYADHPEGIGIGVEFGGFTAWNGWGFGVNTLLSLKFPDLPVFWAVGADINFQNNSGFAFMITGDYYLLDGPIVGDLLHWYMGAGLQLNLGFGVNTFTFGISARIPVGLSLQFPVSKLVLEVYFQVVPTIGTFIVPFKFPAGGIGGSFGFRVWL